MNQITDHIFIGNSQDARDIAAGKNPNNITAVLNVARDLEPAKPEITFHIGLIDGPGNDTQKMIEAIAVLSKLVKEGKKVLVHCHEGISRSPTVVITHLALQWGISVEQATAHVAARRPIIFPNRALTKIAHEIVDGN